MGPCGLFQPPLKVGDLALQCGDGRPVLSRRPSQGLHFATGFLARDARDFALEDGCNVRHDGDCAAGLGGGLHPLQLARRSPQTRPDAVSVRNLWFFSDLDCFWSEKRLQISDRMADLKSSISELIRRESTGRVWVPADFSHLGGRDAVDKALQRLVAAGELRRIDRGLYDRPLVNKLTHRATPPDYRAVVEAIARRDQLRLLVDGMTAANDLGLTDAVPARVTIHTDARRKSVQLENLTIEFKQTAPSRLYWAGRPAMRLVQALHWLRDALMTDDKALRRKLARIVSDPEQGASIRKDLLDGFSAMPIWMQEIVRELPGCDPQLPNALEEDHATARQRAKHAEPSS